MALLVTFGDHPAARVLPAGDVLWPYSLPSLAFPLFPSPACLSRPWLSPASLPGTLVCSLSVPHRGTLSQYKRVGLRSHPLGDM